MNRRVANAGKRLRKGLFLLLAVVLAGCFSACRTAAPRVDDLYLMFMERGAKAYGNEQLISALGHYEQALERAWGVGSSADAADAAYNAGVVALRLGREDVAALYAALALSSAQRSREHAPWEILLLNAKTSYARGEQEHAREFARQATGSARRAGAAPLAETRLFEVRLKLADGRLDEAEAALAEVDAAGNLPLSLQSVALELRAMLAEQRGRLADAGRSFAEAAEMSRLTGHYDNRAAALGEAARCFGAVGEYPRAADYYLQAATAWYGRREWAAALKCVDALLAFGEEAGVADFQRQAGDLLVLIKTRLDNLTEVEE